MKLQKVMLAFICGASISHTASTLSAQVPDAGIRITSGSKLIFEDPGVIKFISDKTLFEKIEELQDDTRWVLQQGVKFVTGQSLRRENISLCIDPQLEFREENGKPMFRYTLAGNSMSFYVTTPDLPFVKIGLDRTADPFFNIEYDLIIDFEVVTAGTVDELRPGYGGASCVVTSFFANGAKIDCFNITPELFKTDEIIAKVASWTSKRFVKDILPSYSTLAGIATVIDKYFDGKIRGNKKLLDEFLIDGDRRIRMEVVEGQNILVINHPYSPSGIVKRVATSDASEVTKENSVTTATGPKTTTSAAELNKAPSSTQTGAGKILKTSRRGN